jgi:hypothetical protein
LTASTNQNWGPNQFIFKLSVGLVCISSIVLIIISSNLEQFCIPIKSRVIQISNEELFFIYAAIFTAINAFLLKFSNIDLYKTKIKSFTFIVILISQLIIIATLFGIYGQIKTYALYYISLLYLVIYTSLTSSALFLAISGTQFLRWYSRDKNHLVLIYSIVMLSLLSNSIIAGVYLSQVSHSHPNIIKRIPCSVMMGALNNPNPNLTNFLINLNDITSFISFILAWVATMFILKDYLYSNAKNKFIYWIIAVLPLIFFLSKYEVALYYFSNNQDVGFSSMIRLDSDIFGYKIFEIIINWNLQIGGALFGLAFLAIAARLPSVKRQRKTLILTGIGMMLLFSSKDISSLFYSSYPPLGAVSIGFIGLASYLVYLGIYGTARLSASDKKLGADLRKKIENNSDLLRSIALSQNQIETEKAVKDLMKLTAEREVEEETPMSQEEIKQIVNEVITEIKDSKLNPTSI